jgi:hypothetical protein
MILWFEGEMTILACGFPFMNIRRWAVTVLLIFVLAVDVIKCGVDYGDCKLLCDLTLIPEMARTCVYYNNWKVAWHVYGFLLMYRVLITDRIALRSISSLWVDMHVIC